MFGLVVEVILGNSTYYDTFYRRPSGARKVSPFVPLQLQNQSNGKEQTPVSRRNRGRASPSHSNYTRNVGSRQRAATGSQYGAVVLRTCRAMNPAVSGL